MKCQLKISTHCKETFKKGKGGIVETKDCCTPCYELWVIRERTKRAYEKDKHKKKRKNAST